jgi:hypothetical protein
MATCAFPQGAPRASAGKAGGLDTPAKVIAFVKALPSPSILRMRGELHSAKTARLFEGLKAVSRVDGRVLDRIYRELDRMYREKMHGTPVRGWDNDLSDKMLLLTRVMYRVEERRRRPGQPGNAKPYAAFDLYPAVIVHGQFQLAPGNPLEGNGGPPPSAGEEYLRAKRTLKRRNDPAPRASHR